MGAGRRKRRLVAAVRRALDAGGSRQPAVSADDDAWRRLVDAGTARRRRRRQRQGGLGTQGQRLPERRASGTRGLGVTRGRSVDGQHLHVHGGRGAARIRARRQTALGSIAARRVRRDHDARRPHDVADHRRRQDHHQRADPELGTGPRPPGQPVFRVRQAHRPDDLGEFTAGPALRHELLDADRRGRERTTAPDRRRHGWRLPRDAGQHRQAGVEHRGQQARDSQQPAVQGQHDLHHAR